MKNLTKLKAKLDDVESDLVWALQHGTDAEAQKQSNKATALRERIAELEGKPLRRRGYAQTLARL